MKCIAHGSISYQCFSYLLFRCSSHFTFLPTACLLFSRVNKNWNKSSSMGCAFTVALYDFTPIYSRLWQSVSMAVGYPGCRTATPRLLNSPNSPHRVLPQVGIYRFQNPVGFSLNYYMSLLYSQVVKKCCLFGQCFDWKQGKKGLQSNCGRILSKL